MSKRERKGFREAALAVLIEAGKPLRFDEITSLALASGLLDTGGKTPEESMHSRLAVSIKEQGDASPFVRTAPGTFGLRAWVNAGTVKPMDPTATHRVKVPEFPTYAQVRALLPVLSGCPRAQVTGLQRSLTEHSATATEIVDWSNPHEWIESRVEPEYRALALAIWTKTKRLVNPRYVLGSWLLANGYGLLDEDAAGNIVVTDDGNAFLDDPAGAVAQRIDEAEGLARILALVAELGPAPTSGLIAPWTEHLLRVSKIRSDGNARAALSQRLRNLIDRGLVERVGRSYAINERGVAWLRVLGVQADSAIGNEQDQDLWKLIVAQKDAVRAGMIEAMAAMAPYAFERLIGRLLEAIGYTDVQVTAPSNDKGVDVVASIELGISSVREVVQAKRQQANIGRPVLDQLRGSLHRFKAVRGTIITTGDFAKGTRDAAFEVGAAPITLINGGKLADMLMDYGIGVKKRDVVLWELDRDAFAAEADE